MKETVHSLTRILEKQQNIIVFVGVAAMAPISIAAGVLNAFSDRFGRRPFYKELPRRSAVKAA